MRPVSRRLAPLIVLLLPVLAAGCGAEAQPKGGPETLTVYSGRAKDLVEPLYDRFEKATGVEVEVRYGESAELAATIAEEGDNSPADVFLAQDAGSIGSLAEDARLERLPANVLGQVDERFRDDDGRWVGVSGRARVVAYNTEKVAEGDLPSSVFDLTDPRWKGRVGLPPGNASFQAFVSAMRLDAGEERTRAWLEGLKRNDAKTFDNNIQTLEAVGKGEIDVGLVNHYYLREVKGEQPDLPVANHFLKPGDPGALVNAAAVGVLEGNDTPSGARTFVEFLLSPEGQRFFVEETDEYPLVAGVAPPRDTPPLEDVQGPDVPLDRLGGEFEATLKLLDEVGLAS